MPRGRPGRTSFTGGSLPTRGGRSTALTTEERNKLPDRAFTFPERRTEDGYPIPTVAELRKAGAPRPEVSGERHALNAIERVDAYGTPYEREKVREMVRIRYPEVLAPKA